MILIFLDQITKYQAVQHLKDHEPFVLWEGVFELNYLENRGAAFGILQNRRWLLVIFTVLVLAVIVDFYLRRIPAEKKFRYLDFIAILLFSGAVGNFIDRVSQSYVVDFFYFKLIDFPIFNVADIYVTVAAVLLILFGMFYYKEEDFERLFSSKNSRNAT